MHDMIHSTKIAEIERELRHISAIIKQKGREILLQYPITPPQFVALQWLADKGDMTTGELSSTIKLAISTTTDMVDRLEKNELVMRVRDEKDRRIVRIHLLDKGKHIIQEVIEKRREYLGDLLQHFTGEQIEQFNDLLAHLHDNMNQLEAAHGNAKQKKRR